MNTFETYEYLIHFEHILNWNEQTYAYEENLK